MKVILVVVAAGFSLVAHAGEFNLEKTYGMSRNDNGSYSLLTKKENKQQAKNLDKQVEVPKSEQSFLEEDTYLEEDGYEEKNYSEVVKSKETSDGTLKNYFNDELDESGRKIYPEKLHRKDPYDFFSDELDEAGRRVNRKAALDKKPSDEKSSEEKETVDIFSDWKEVLEEESE